jgi:hypothetical protein
MSSKNSKISSILGIHILSENIVNFFYKVFKYAFINVILTKFSRMKSLGARRIKYRPHPQTSFGGLSLSSPSPQGKILHLRILKRGNSYLQMKLISLKRYLSKFSL